MFKRRYSVYKTVFQFFAFLLTLSLVVNILYHSRLPEPHDRSVQRNHQRNQSLWKTSDRQVEKVDKNGNILHHKITAIRSEDLKGIGDDKDYANISIDMETARKGREPLLAILEDAGVIDIEPSSIVKLPTWKEVTDLYGDGPVIYGLDTCDRFQKEIPLDDASVGVAGLFNTGTNPLAMYLEANCVMPHNDNDKHKGMRWQVPWGKHSPASFKWNNTAGHDQRVNKTNVLPVVLIRDPFSWMQSMCKHPYAASWSHSSSHCPNLVPTEEERKKGWTGNSVPVTIKINSMSPMWPSLLHLWSDWYRQYMHADYPRLIVRFEDVIFHQKELVSIICNCAGAVPKTESFSYVVDTGKWGHSHTGSSNMISAMVKYGRGNARFSSLTDADMIFARDKIDWELMSLFQYKI